MPKNRESSRLARVLIVGALSLFVLASASCGASMEWGDIRDGSLYLLPKQAGSARLSWKAAWQADANREQIHLTDGAGRLLERLDIRPEQTRGEQVFALTPGKADYRLGIPGYSFRAYRVTHDAAVAAQFEPAKVHFSIDAPRNAEFYFRVAAGAKATLNGKHHGGVNALRIMRLSDASALRLDLREHAQYSSFDSLPLPTSRRDEIWRLNLEGSGKAAFWLDGADNLFAQKPEHLHPLTRLPGRAALTLREDSPGATPRLGVGLPYTLWPESGFASLDALDLQAAGFYSFVDVLSRQPEREIGFRRQYNQRFGIGLDLTLLSKTGRKPVLAADQQTLTGVDAWLADSIRLNSGGLHYLAFADEPNLNYPDYDSFEKYFAVILRHVRANAAARAAGVRIAAPASSRFGGGPFREDAGRRRGASWTEKLLQRHGDDIDAIVWHEWMLRDLFSTRRYRDDIQAAARLVGLDAKGRPRKALLINQTNISSGASVSPYQQDTHFAALWWVSVAINASGDGLLDMLNWFLVADDADHPKGMLRNQGSRFELRPVALAQQFMRRHWLPWVQRLENDAFEVDALAMRDGRRHSLLGVNKSARVQQVSLAGAAALCRSGAKLEFFAPDSRVRAAHLNCKNDAARFDLPGETLFALTWEEA
ncbi:MAG: hypothetical protein LBD68_06960 [Zoogloeaceae bacterium]|jgi:hypothetical protein|nr:hypothetical protein [Zoogloeaceae bacterium]